MTDNFINILISKDREDIEGKEFKLSTSIPHL